MNISDYSAEQIIVLNRLEGTGDLFKFDLKRSQKAHYHLLGPNPYFDTPDYPSQAGLKSDWVCVEIGEPNSKCQMLGVLLGLKNHTHTHPCPDSLTRSRPWSPVSGTAVSRRTALLGAALCVMHLTRSPSSALLPFLGEGSLLK